VAYYTHIREFALESRCAPGKRELAGVIRVVSRAKKGFMGGLLWTIIVVMVVLWLLGFTMHVGGGLIHLLLVIAVVLLVVNLLTGRGARV
jgi:hypothetical protein